MLVELYGKKGCHLCEVAREILLELQEEAPFELREVDISADPALYARYRWDIPVIAVDGEEWARHRIDPETERRLLDRASGR